MLLLAALLLVSNYWYEALRVEVPEPLGLAIKLVIGDLVQRVLQGGLVYRQGGATQQGWQKMCGYSAAKVSQGEVEVLDALSWCCSLAAANAVQSWCTPNCR